MTNKSAIFNIKPKIDDTEFNQKIQAMERRINSLGRFGGIGGSTSQPGSISSYQGDTSTTFGKAAQQAFNRQSQQELQGMKRKFNEMEMERSKEEKFLQKKERSLKIIEEKQKRNLELTERETDLLEKQEKYYKGINRQNEILTQAKRLDPNLEGFKGAETSSGGGPGGPGDQQGMMAKFGGMLRALMGSAVFQGAMNVGTTLYEEQFVTRDRRMQQYRGQASRLASREMYEAASGTASDAYAFADERARAMGMAAQERDRQSNLDLVRGAGGGAAGALIGGAAGAALAPAAGIAGAKMGAGAGAFLGPVGAMVGGIAGGAIGYGGAIVGGALGGGYLGAGERGRARLFDQERYNQMSVSEMMQNRASIEADLIAQDPEKKIARDFFRSNLSNMVDMQRRTGIRQDKDYFGKRDSTGKLLFGETDPITGEPIETKGFLPTQMEAGMQYGGRMLRMQDIENQVRTIQDAGGTTGGAQLSGFAAAMQRQTGMSNVGGTLGRMMGASGLGAEGTESAFKKLMVEAVAQGVDISKMPKEMERMTAMTAQLASAGGGFSESAVRAMGMGLGGLSQTEIQAAGTAFQEFESTSKESEGFEGQLGFGFLLGDKGAKAFGKDAIKKIRGDHKLMSMVNQYSAADLEKDPALRKGMARAMGISEEELVNAMDELGTFKQTRSTEEAEALGRLGEMRKGKTVQQIKELETGESEEAQEYQKLMFTAQKERAATRGKQFTRKGAAEREATLSLIGGKMAEQDERRDMEGVPEMLKRPDARAGAAFDVDKALKTKITGAAGEAELDAQARQDQYKVGLMGDRMGDFEKAAEAVTGAGTKFSTVFDAVSKALDENGGKMNDTLEKLTEQLEKMSEQMSSNGYVSAKSGG